MIEWNDTDRKVFAEYTRPIVHMRRQFHSGHFGLMFGAGISELLRVPLWSKLNRKIAKDTEVGAEDLCNANVSEPMLTKRLFEHYKTKQKLPANAETKEAKKNNLRVTKKWMQIIHRHLYSDIKRSGKTVQQSHPYLGQYLTIIRNSDLTVSYNFDDFIEKMLFEERSVEEKKSTKGYQVVTNLMLPLGKKSRVIYHPNGYLPSSLSEASSNLVFTEDNFADQLIGVMEGNYSALIHHLCTNTCLFIGLSLSDATLKHLLRQAFRLNPGHCHYYVQHYVKGKEFTDDQKAAIRNANFETYNLVTLFLNDEEIASLGKIIGSGQDSDSHVCDIPQLVTETNKESVYIYYIIGAIGVGKSTTISRFKDMSTYDEWTEPRDLELGKEPEKVDAQKLSGLDQWIAKQFSYKNTNLWNEKPGIIIVDRCPLDPISFTDRKDWPKKAELLANTLKKDIKPGHIIMLKDDPAILELRSIPTYKEYSEERLRRLQKDLSEVYSMGGISIIDAQYMTQHELVKEMARIIHMKEYQAIDIQKRLIEIQSTRAQKDETEQA